jgi:hypothetical protein
MSRAKTSSFRKAGIKFKFLLNLHDFKSPIFLQWRILKRSACRSFVESFDLRRLFEKQRARWEDNINIDLKEIG